MRPSHPLNKEDYIIGPTIASDG